MTDAFDALAEPVVPQAPDPSFTAELRTRIRRALLTPTGELMTSEATTPDSGTATAAGTNTGTNTGTVSAQQHSLAPYLAVDDARGALDWYTRVFAAERRGEPYLMEDGRIGHAELVIGDSVLMLADEYPELGLRGPKARGGASVSLALQVPDVDATVELALAEGADLVYPVSDEDYGRRGAITDPYGHRWLISAAVPATAPPPVAADAPAAAPRRGELAYVTLAVPDDEAAKAFYGAVLGWRFAPGGVERGWNIEGTTPPMGLWGGASASQVQLCYAVEDIDDAAAEVVRRGGRAQAPQEQSYGVLAECTDDQGVDFQLWQPPRH